MPEKKPKKVPFTENNAATLTQRYDATTVLTLLQEVAQYSHVKIDWNELVKKTSTGICNAREYQMLWRHLAYRDALVDNLEDGAEPLDDDSDLECEPEVSPPISAESASEAASCVKVMIASRALSDSTPSSSTIEAPLTINVPVWHSSRAPNDSSHSSDLMQGTNIIFPVTVQRQTLPTVSSTDGIETKGSNMASKRKRKAWSEEEDIQLRAAVQRFGEGNWATMAKGDNFPIKRSPTQLAQRWSILRKKDGSTNSGAILTSTPYTTAEQLATRHSLSLALDMPFKKLTAPGTTHHARTSLNMSSKNQVQHNTSEASTICSSLISHQQPMTKSNSTPNPAIKATAVAVGARIVTPSNATSHVKVVQARNVASTSSSLAKPSTPVGLSSESKVQVCSGSSGASIPSKSTVAIPSIASCPNTVKFAESKVQVCTGSSGAYVPSTSAVAITSSTSCPSTVKVSSSKVNSSPNVLSILSGKDKHVTSPVSEVATKQEVNIIEEFRGSDTNPTSKERVQNVEKLIQDKSMNTPVEEGTTLVVSARSEEVIEDNSDSKNQEVCGDLGNKESQDLGQQNNKSSVNGSSQDQNMNKER